MAKPTKPAWVIDKERARRAAAAETLWLFGIHAVRDALMNPARQRLRLVVTRNAADRLTDAIAASGMDPEIADARKFPVPLDPGSVHQGAALEVRPLDWGALEACCAPAPDAPALSSPPPATPHPKPARWPRLPAVRWSASPTCG